MKKVAFGGLAAVLLIFTQPAWAQNMSSDIDEADLFSTGQSVVPFEEMMLDDSVRAEAKLWVEECAKRVPEGKRATVNSTHMQLCVKPATFWSNPMRYLVVKHAGALQLAFKIRLRMDEDKTKPDRAAEILKNAEACIKPIQDVWARYGVEFLVRFDSNFDESYGRPDQYIDLIDAAGRSNARTFYYLGKAPPNEAERQDQFCRMILHETGHMVNLDDEYKEEKCPDRWVSKERDPVSIMRAIWGMKWDDFDFFPRHVKAALKPICGS
jgi:hypothetical protein